ncbi:hypothetical protein F0562_002621 [Nyssa sinensis]|uniref:Nuclear pore complex protein NUP214 n=1 Tax=Nyssa sinensis TaxID=561372 RepID=A0A5J5CA16_9ASTE|nr:hypothetical protein F0562_002621 [Nyssa sinensis]
MAPYEVGTDDENSIIIQLDEEVEGTHQGSDDFCFIKIGEPVSIKHGDDSQFDLESPPSQPLAVSGCLGLLFVAHSTGFCVTRTKDVLESAKEIEDKGSGLSLQELSVVDVPIGKVHILALSADSSTLAASIGGEIHFFSVNSLVSKGQKSSFSCSINDSSCIKDMRWTKKLENYYIVLSNCGKLYYGDGQGPLKDVMDNVDAVEWSVKGSFVAVARKNILSILSSKLELKLSMSLLFKSWIGDSDANCIIKVDSIRWVRSDCIILGCFQLTGDGKEENYQVQVITSKDGKITDVSSKPIVLYFDDIFEGLIDDIVPFGSGPHLLLSYLDQCELAITANRKNTGQHIALLGWSLDEKNEAAVIDLLRDTWLPRIELQGNDDDNLILGLYVDKVSHDEKIKLELGGEEKELSPYCILWCLTVEGKLIMFHVTSVTGASVPAETVSALVDEEEDSPKVVPSECAVDKSLTTTPFADQISHKETITGNLEVRTIVNSRTSKTDGQQKVPIEKLNQDTDGRQSLLSGQQSRNSEQSFLEDPRRLIRDFSKTETQKLGVESSIDSFLRKSSTDKSSQSIHMDSQKGIGVGKELPGSIGSTSIQSASSQLWSSGKLSYPMASDGGSSLSSSGFINQADNSCASIAHFRGGPVGKPSCSKDTAGQSTSVNPSGRTADSGQSASTGLRKIEPLPSDGASSLSSSGFIHSNQADNSCASIAHFPGGPVGKPSCSKDTAGQSTSVIPSGRTADSGQSVSTGLRKIEPLPSIGNSQLPSQENFALGKASNDKFRPNKENYRNPSLTGPLNSESKLSKQSGNLEEMTKELEGLLESIERAGGYRDACTVLTKSSVVALEEGLGTLSDKCRMWRSKMDIRLGEIQQLLDKTVQVLARKIYMEGLVKQATDNRYWDLWNRQKLSSELELKRQHIIKVNQDLTNQLIELERHFNTLELNKFGENSGARMGQKGFPSRFGASRQVHSLHSLHNTMISQLATAEATF